MSKGKRMATRAEMKENKRKRRQAKKDGKLLRASKKKNRRYAPKRQKKPVTSTVARSTNTNRTKNTAQKTNKKLTTKSAPKTTTKTKTKSALRTTARTKTKSTPRTTNQTKTRSTTSRKPKSINRNTSKNLDRTTYGYNYYQQRRRKRKINKFRVFIALLILIAIISTPIYLVKKITEKKETKEIPQETTPSIEPTQYEPSPSVEPTIDSTIEDTEDEKIKDLIQKTIQDNQLTEEKFAFFYYNTNTKKYYFYNENKYMTGGSVVKMPIAMIYYDMLKAGEITLDDKIEYKKESYEAGAGATSSMYKVGQSVPIKYLIEQSIINSDNTATNILISKMGYKEYRQAVAKFSTVNDLPDEFYEGNIISARYGYDVCKHLYENMSDYEGLIELLKKSSNGSYLKKYLTNTEVAHKYGSYEGYEHDYGIVFGKNTYLVGIFTNEVKNSEEFISKLSQDIFNVEEAEE